MTDFFRALLFERPLFLAVPAVVVQFILIRRWAFRRDSRSSRLMLAGFAIWPMLFALQAWIVTDREAIRELMETVRTAIEQRDTQTFAHTVSDNFEAYGMRKQELIRRMGQAEKDRSVRQLKFTEWSFTESGDEAAEVTFNATADLDNSTSIMARVLTRWKLTLGKVPDGWRIESFQFLPHALSPVKSFQEVIRYTN